MCLPLLWRLCLILRTNRKMFARISNAPLNPLCLKSTMNEYFVEGCCLSHDNSCFADSECISLAEGECISLAEGECISLAEGECISLAEDG